MLFLHGTSPRRIAVSIALGVSLLAAAQPVVADTELGHTGTVGVRSLTDTTSSPGALCDYKWVSDPSGPGPDYVKLWRLRVGAPRMKAVAGNPAQTVGWRIIVQRRYGAIGSTPPWLDKFTSAEFTAVTSATNYATFNVYPQISVTLPYGPYVTGQFAQYRIVMELIWHKPNGSIQGTDLRRVDHYGLYSSPTMVPKASHCDAYWYP